MSHSPYFRWGLFIWRLSFLAVVAALALSAAGSASSEPAYSVYLPLMLDRPCQSPGQAVFGCVEQNGLRLAGAPLTLFYYKSPATTPTSQVTTNSDANGYFGFDAAPGATSSDTYLAQFSNTTDPARLKGWNATFGADPNFQSNLGIVDLTNVPLLAPANGLHISLPYTFTWGARDTSPHDRYLFFMVDPNNDHVQYQTQLEHVGALPMTSLPFGFQDGVQYKWLVHVTFDNVVYASADIFQPFLVTFDAPNAQALSGANSRLAGPLWRVNP